MAVDEKAELLVKLTVPLAGEPDRFHIDVPRWLADEVRAHTKKQGDLKNVTLIAYVLFLKAMAAGEVEYDRDTFTLAKLYRMLKG